MKKTNGINRSETLKEEYRTGKRKSWNKGLKCSYGPKISLKIKGKIPKNLAELNINRFGKNNPMFGKRHSSETKVKIGLKSKK